MYVCVKFGEAACSNAGFCAAALCQMDRIFQILGHVACTCHGPRCINLHTADPVGLSVQVSRLGVTSILVDTAEGVSVRVLKQGLDQYSQNAAARGAC